ncbi:MAG: hypothetical protein K2Q18_10315, partial [Bdellovibrionales bacterium]|nr:hypothetical protein [Bdellovibrionales bacterium]
EKKKKLISQFPVESVSVTPDSDNKTTSLKIVTKGLADIRAEIARFLVAPEIGLLELSLEKGELEDLFKRMKA